MVQWFVTRKLAVIVCLVVVSVLVVGYIVAMRAHNEAGSGIQSAATNVDDRGDAMYLETLVVGDIDANCYIVASEHGAEAIVIDPGDNAQLIFDTISAVDLNVKYILLTHGHWDHFGAAAELAKMTGAEIAIHKLDKKALEDPKQSLAYMFGESSKDDFANVKELEDGDVIKFGELEAEILHTPGHSPGSITVRVGNVLFTGDLLFQRSIGRTDFPGGSSDSLIKSVKERIFTYPDQVKVYPGHGPSTSVGEERRENPYF